MDRWGGRKIPAATLTTLYLDDAIDFNMDVLEVGEDQTPIPASQPSFSPLPPPPLFLLPRPLQALESIDDFVCYMPSWPTIKFLIKQLYPNSGNSSLKDKKTTKREIADHYDRGNDFFNAFLGERMVYTSAVFEKDDDTLETAQDNKMRKICEKLRLKPGDRLLDIGCGWGTLVGYANRHFHARATGVTLSQEGAKWSREHNKAEEGKGSVDFIVTDYRDIPEVSKGRGKHWWFRDAKCQHLRSVVREFNGARPSSLGLTASLSLTHRFARLQTEKFNAISSVEMAEHVGLANFQMYLEKVKTNLEDDGAFYIQVAGLRKGSDWKDIAWGLFMGEVSRSE